MSPAPLGPLGFSFLQPMAPTSAEAGLSPDSPHTRAWHVGRVTLTGRALDRTEPSHASDCCNHVYLRKRLLKLVFLSQFPYKFVNLCGE
ncbi:hypothetical protein T484DRAFT_3179532 [Baffinella frigidus]|nr:hypothetical protein T484DRAFT_3179532 [Cryptophyta sp. CCMP2293]